MQEGGRGIVGLIGGNTKGNVIGNLLGPTASGKREQTGSGGDHRAPQRRNEELSHDIEW
jgi:hypothetical protein